MARKSLSALVDRLKCVVDDRASALAAAASTEAEPVGRIEKLRHILAVLSADHRPAAPGDGDVVADLGDIFGLDECEQRLLVVAAAPHIDDSFAVAYDLLTAGEHRVGLPTVGLALELCDVPTGSRVAAELLDESGALRRHRLIACTADGTLLRRYLTIPESVVARLLGVARTPPEIDRIRTDPLVLADETTPVLTRALLAGMPLIWCRGGKDTPGPGIAAGAFEEVDLEWMAVDLRRAPATSSVTEVVALAARTAALAGRGLIVTGLDVGPHVHGGSVSELAPVVHAMEQAAVPVIVVGDLRWQDGWARRTPLLVDLKPISAQVRERLWDELTGDPALAGSLAHLRLAPEDMLAVVRHARTLAMSRGIGQLTVELIQEASRALGAVAGTTIMSGRARGRLTFDDLVVPPTVEADLRRMVRWGEARSRLSEVGQIFGKAGKGSGVIALFTGGPGTGKTMAAHVVSDELGLELMQVNLSGVVDKYIGETEKNLERIFAQAEMRNVVLFFDEADALFGSRSEVKDSRDRYANQEVSYLLQRLERYDGVAVLATNLRGNLDSAFVRRIQLIIHFGDPDESSRLQLWNRHLAEAGPLDSQDPIDIEMLASAVDVAGGDIKNVVLGACFEAVGRGERLGMRHIREATVREFGKLGRRLPAALSG